MQRYDYIVVGAGPSGLAFASTVKNAKVIVVDYGKEVSQRDRFNPQECVQGAGGAGLFSDGKFSFYPAGTEIWNHDLSYLRKAYFNLEKDLIPFGTIPPFPKITETNKNILDQTGWCLKPYPSMYLSLQDRIKLVQTLADRCSEIRYQTEYISFKGSIVKLKDFVSGSIYEVETDKLVLAGGRFMPLFIKGPKRFRRYEFGFRVKGPTSIIRKGVDLTDPKYVFDSPLAEYRTFCWCENGEVIKTSFNGIETFSGRADCPATGINNFGFNIRIKDPFQITEGDFRKLISMLPYEININEFVEKIPSLFGPTVSPLVADGCRKLKEKFPDLFCEAVNVLGPTIEGVGYYPDFSDIYVIGDCSGVYRGIVPSMLAGYLLAVSDNRSVHELELIETLT